MKLPSIPFSVLAASFAVLAPFASAQTYSVSNGPMAIPASGTGGGGTWATALPPNSSASSVTLPSGAATIGSLTFTGLAHSWVGDVHFVLEDPNGGKHNVITRLGFTGTGAGSNSDFNAANTITISDAGAPFPGVLPNPIAAGTYAPHFGTAGGLWPTGNLGITNDPLSAIPVVPGGTYTLRVYDWVSGDVGALASWSIQGAEVVAACNIDFDDASGSAAGVPSPAYAGAGVAGVWNAISPSPSNAPLVDLSGFATSMTISGLAGPFTFDNAGTSGDDAALLDDVADPSPASSYTINGVPSGTYEVIVYAWAPDNRTGFLTDVTISGGVAGTQTCGGATWSGSHVEGVTFVRDTTVVTGGSITIAVATNTGFASVNGLQLRRTSGSIDPSTYCVSALSVNGCTPVMSFSGTPSVAASSGFTVAMINADGLRTGGMFYGFGPASIPFGSGSATLCTTAPRKRLLNPLGATSGTTGACDGALSVDLLAFIAANPSTLGAPFVAGDTLYLQGWNRDNGNGSKNIATSNGLRVTFQP